MSEAEKTMAERRSDWRGKGIDHGLPRASIVLDRYAAFMAKKEAEGEHFSDRKAKEWADRFSDQEEFHYADKENKVLLLKQMAQGIDATRKHFDRETMFTALEQLRREDE